MKAVEFEVWNGSGIINVDNQLTTLLFYSKKLKCLKDYLYL